MHQLLAYGAGEIGYFLFWLTVANTNWADLHPFRLLQRPLTVPGPLSNQVLRGNATSVPQAQASYEPGNIPEAKQNTVVPAELFWISLQVMWLLLLLLVVVLVLLVLLLFEKTYDKSVIRFGWNDSPILGAVTAVAFARYLYAVLVTVSRVSVESNHLAAIEDQRSKDAALINLTAPLKSATCTYIQASLWVIRPQAHNDSYFIRVAFFFRRRWLAACIRLVWRR